MSVASEGTKSGAYFGQPAVGGRSGAGSNLARLGAIAHTNPASKTRLSTTNPAELPGFLSGSAGGILLFELDSTEDIRLHRFQLYAKRHNLYSHGQGNTGWRQAGMIVASLVPELGLKG